MAGGRPPKGPELVDGLAGTEEAKAKLKSMLETIAGTKTIREACVELGIQEAMFHRLRERTLQEAVAGLEPRPMGRPRREEVVEPSRMEELQRQVVKLERDLSAARVREEIAVALPGLRGRGRQKKTRTR